MTVELGNLSGRIAVVTGGNSGIGYHAAAELAKHGAEVTLACRNLDAGKRAAERLRRDVSGVVEVAELDLASLASVEAFTQSWAARPLNLLINNAGLMAPPKRRETEDGFELQFGTNHLGHFALTGRLLPALLAADRARVVTVSSLAHRNGGADVLFANAAAADAGRNSYNPMLAYSNSKLANLLFGLELQRRAVGTGLSSTIAHPGVSSTNLFKSPDGIGASALMRRVGGTVGKLAFQSARAGAEPLLYAAVLAEPGTYTGPRWFGEVRGGPSPARMSAAAQDPELAAQLWDLSEELTGVTYHWDVDTAGR